jgi:CBS domain containing-hemolysin-like protein
MAPEISLSTTFAFIALSFVLVGLNAFFVAAEFAIVKVRRTRLEELAGQGIASARVSLRCVDDLDESLSATQLGITLVSLALGWIGEESFYNLIRYFAPVLTSEKTMHAVSLGFSFLIVTLLHVVLGELVPKSLAIQRAEKVALVVSPPLRWFYRAARPLIRFFTWLANRVLHLLGLNKEEEAAYSEEELKIVVHESHEEGVISESEAGIIENAFSFSDKRAADILIPLDQVAYLSLSRSFEENMESARKRMYTRFPLTADGPDTILGVVHMKDVLHYPAEWDSNEVFRKVMRPACYVSADTPQDRVLQELKQHRTHLAIVRDPASHGRLAGIVTLEDILQALVGEIPDEYAVESPPLPPVSPGLDAPIGRRPDKNPNHLAQDI